ncbi:MAG TPA: hypothetical protein DGG95_09070 [Cytophagales bacterium]|nr:hypothetical protein [Cytophagales bacterium]
MKALLTILFFCLVLTGYAQTGSVKGVIKDTKTSESVIGATVRVEGTTLGAATDVDGEFTISGVPVGTYNLTVTSVGYTSKKFENVKVEANNATVIITTLEEESVILEGVTVQTVRLTSTDVSVVKELREAKTVVSLISGAQISKTQDRDAAEVVRRIPGVTIFDNRFVNVRGLNDRYNSVWLNDAASPSTEAEKKSFSFDIIPSQVIDRILVAKSPSPELPGDFAGGMVRVYTRTSMPSNNFIVNFSQGYRAGTTGANFNYNSKSSTDFLGYDDGMRNVPISNTNLANLTQVDREAAATQFKNTWAINKMTAIPDTRFSVTKGSSFNILGKSIEAVSMINYSNTYTVFNQSRKDFDPQTDYSDNQSTNQIRLGAMQNFGVRLNENHRIEGRFLWNRIGQDQTTIRNGLQAPYEKSYLESYQWRRLLSAQLNGKHTMREGKSEFTWASGYSSTYRNAPDLKRMGYFQYIPNGPFVASVQSGVDTRYGGRFYQKLNEDIMSLALNYTHKIDIGRTRIDLSAGVYGESRSRDFSARSLGYITDNTTGAGRSDGLTVLELKQLPIDKIFSPQYVGPGGFAMSEITNGTDAYHGENHLFAQYVSLGVPIGQKIKINGGIRREDNQQTIDTHDTNGTPIHAPFQQVNWLPSINTSYNFNQKMLVRATYGKSLNRPEFREWAPFHYYDFDLNVDVYGSLYPSLANGGKGALLKVAEIDNFDLRYEWYISSQEMLHIGLFYKNFKNPIEQVFPPSGNRIFTFTNAPSAFAYGLEIDFRKNLGFIGGGLFHDMTLIANASLIKSEVHNDKPGQIQRRPLQGQSPYVINAGFYYQHEEKGISGSLTYNVFGPRIFLVGDANYGSWGELPRNTIDVAINYPISKRTSITFAVQDLLNQPVQLVQDGNGDNKFDRHTNDNVTNASARDLTIRKFTRGQYFNLGIKLTL